MLQNVSEFYTLLRQNNIPLYYKPCFIYSSVELLSSFQLLTSVNNATVNMGVNVSQYPDFIFFGCIPRSEIARS